jgi:hypothetical protein
VNNILIVLKFGHKFVLQFFFHTRLVAIIGLVRIRGYLLQIDQLNNYTVRKPGKMTICFQILLTGSMFMLFKSNYFL